MIEISLQKTLKSASGKFHLDVALSFGQGQFVALYGASGAGKSTTLKLISGLMKADHGYIRVGNEIWLDTANKVSVSPQLRGTGIVFQDYALFPNMTVRENIAFALNGADRGISLSRLAGLMDLENLLAKKPHQLSGGQQQRVALARALARKPKLLVLDEPFTALDSDLRMRMQDLVKRMQLEFNLTVILISHDILDVAQLASTVFVIEGGSIIKSGSPSEVIPGHHIQQIADVLKNKLGTHINRP